jgi:hypothetical protein
MLTAGDKENAMATLKWNCNRYRVTAELNAQGPRIGMVYEAESGAIVAKRLDEIEAQAVCDQFNGGKVTETLDAHRSQ